MKPYDKFDEDEYIAIFAECGIDKSSDIVKQVLDTARTAETAAHELGFSEGYDEGHNEGVEEGRNDAIDDQLDDIATFVNLAKSDPQSAAVYFHRATGKHLFEVQQPCLL